MKIDEHRAKALAIERSLARCTTADYETVIEAAMLAGTHWFISAATGLAGVVMAQRHFGFWHPHWFAYRRQVYAAAAA